MKIKLFIVSITTGIVLAGCNNMKEKSAEELMKNPGTEQEIYSEIISNNAHLSKFIDKMMEDENSKTMLMRDKLFIKMVCMSPNMDTLMNTDRQVMERWSNLFINKMAADSALCDQTCIRLSTNDRLRNYFRMHPSPLIKNKNK